ncbi:MAG: peptidoglycan-binding protein, partial [Patescibacteria group bacterium]
MKQLAFIPALVAILFASAVSAQVYYPNYSYGSSLPVQTNCVVLSSDLSFGSRGSEVSKLQQFLVSQNYPGGGSWMVTGYFGNATVQAVRNFQQSAGLSMTGFVDGQTRSAIQTHSCGYLGNDLQNSFNYGNNVYPYNYSYTTPTYTTPSYVAPSYAYTAYQYGTNPWSISPVINSLSVTSGGQGTVVTVYGANFDVLGTSVRFGVTSIVPAINPTQTSFTFTIPNVPSGSYPVSVTTSRGASNSLSFNVTGNTGLCGWGYTYLCAPVQLSSLSPISGVVGTMVTIYGNGFSTTNNTVYFGGVTLPNV